MIETICQCGAPFSAPEASAGQALNCGQCGQQVHIISAEPLADGAGAGDFDAHLLIQSGPKFVGEQIFIGGVAEITLGKLPDRTIVLAGAKVSRGHCKLVRLDFGPSRWELHDNKSTNGLFINNERITQQELKDGDVVVIGEYEMKFISCGNAPAELEAILPESEADAPAAQSTRALRVKALNYGTAATEQRLLGDCDINWVMRLRNASVLMVWVININFLKRFLLPNIEALDVGVDMLTSVMSWMAAWLLTTAELGAPESSSWFSVRFFLRLAASITVCGELVTAVAILTENQSLIMPGLLLSLMMVPQTGLFLFYLRRLALRIPSTGLAINAMIVMIGLPAMLGLTISAAIIGLASNSPGLAILTGLGGLLGLLVFRIWYLILLIWFNRSFS